MHRSLAVTVFAPVLSYFIITSITKTLSVDSLITGPRVNRQYIMKGLVPFLFTMRSLGFLILNKLNLPNISEHLISSFSLICFLSIHCLCLTFFIIRLFLKNETSRLSERLECLLRRSQQLIDLFLSLKFQKLYQPSKIK